MVARDEVLNAHAVHKGKIEIIPKVVAATKDELSTFYTPGVALVSEEIKNDKLKSYTYTNRQNTIAIVSDGTRILGLGNIGPEAGMPVMEGKALLFKRLGGIDAIPLCIGTTDEEEIIKFVKYLAPSVGGINIEDIESPKSFRIVNRLSESLDIPVLHDDQHGTAVVAAAALLNSLKLAGKKVNEVKIVLNGAGSAGFGIFNMLRQMGAKNLYVLDREGIIYKGRKERMNEFKEIIANNSNPDMQQGTLESVVKGADVLIGASEANRFTKDMIRSMNDKAIVFALANPTPEISYEEAKEAGAFIVATGRSDKPNQVNNILAFPGIMRGLLDAGAKRVDYELLLSAAVALAKTVGKELSPDFILPSVSDKKSIIKIASKMAAAVAENATARGIAKFDVSPESVKENTKQTIKRYLKIEGKVVGKI